MPSNSHRNGNTVIITPVSLNNVKKAIRAALELHDNANPNDYNIWYKKKITLAYGEEVNVGCKLIYENYYRFDCGLPPFYQMSVSDLDNLRYWFEGYSRSAEVLPPERKGSYGNLIANAVWGNFNYHVELGEFNVWKKVHKKGKKIPKKI